MARRDDRGGSRGEWEELLGELDRRRGSLPRVTRHPGFHSRAELVEEYAKKSGRAARALELAHGSADPRLRS